MYTLCQAVDQGQIGRETCCFWTAVEIEAGERSVGSAVVILRPRSNAKARRRQRECKVTLYDEQARRNEVGGDGSGSDEEARQEAQSIGPSEKRCDYV